MMLLDAVSSSLVSKMRCLVLPVLLVFCCCFARADAALPGNIPLYFPTAQNPAPGWWADYGAIDGFPVSSNATAQVWNKALKNRNKKRNWF